MNKKAAAVILSLAVGICSAKVFANNTYWEGHYNTCDERFYDVMDFIFDTSRYGHYGNDSIVAEVKEIQDRSQSLRQHSRWLSEESDPRAWKFVDLDKSINGAINNQILPNIHDTMNNQVNTRNVLQELQRMLNSPEYRKRNPDADNFKGFVGNALVNLNKAQASIEQARQGVIQVRVKVEQTDERMQRDLTQKLKNFSQQARQISLMADGVERVSFNLVGRDYFGNRYLDPRSKLGILESRMDEMFRSCIATNR